MASTWRSCLQCKEERWDGSLVGMMGAAAAGKNPTLMLKSRQTDKLYFAFPALARPVCSSGGTTVCWVPSTCHLALIRINLFANFKLCLETQHLVKLNFGQDKRIVATFSKAFGYPIWLKSLWDWVTIEINPSFKITNKAIKRGVKLNQSEH